MKIKKGKKFVPLLDENQIILLPGRHPCTCEGTSHQLINNCLNCGRIVCCQEGIGPCFTCSNNVNYKKILSNSKNDINQKSDFDEKNENCKNDHLKSYNLKNIAASLSKAIEHRDRLLEFDQNCDKKTKVIDDQRDYFKLESQNWISSDQRINIQEKVEYLQSNKFLKQRNLFIDIENCKFNEEEAPIIADINKYISDLNQEEKIGSDYELIDCKSINLNQELPKVEYINNN